MGHAGCSPTIPRCSIVLEAADSTSNARQGLPRRSWLSRYKVHTQSILWIQPLRYDPFLAHFSLRTSLNPKRRTRRKGLVELDKTSVTVRPLWNRDGSRPTLSVVMRVGNRLHPWYGQASLQQSQTGNARPLHLEVCPLNHASHARKGYHHHTPRLILSEDYLGYLALLYYRR